MNSPHWYDWVRHYHSSNATLRNRVGPKGIQSDILTVGSEGTDDQ